MVDFSASLVTFHNVVAALPVCQSLEKSLPGSGASVQVLTALRRLRGQRTILDHTPSQEQLPPDHVDEHRPAITVPWSLETQ
jgi:hypothetical protein